MRDRRYVAEHRGGPLSKERHQMLAMWAADCVEHVLSLFADRCPDDPRPWLAMVGARDWARGEISVGKAREVAVAAHAAARDAESDVATYIARAAGHAVATAHAADHAPGVVWYIRKAVVAAGGDADAELRWQVAQLPDEIRELVVSTLRDKFHLEI